ncbi:MAG: tyrosine-type recombinase/integrase [Bdellovibrio sp.]|nr:tyrosine-type recombinase/integrase [Bdellovibrio sp.]
MGPKKLIHIVQSDSNSVPEPLGKWQKAYEFEFEFFKNFPSAHTRISYRSDIRQFIDWLKDNMPDLDGLHQAARAHLVAYRNWLQEAEFAPKTINRKFSALSSFFDFLVEKGIKDFNPVNSVRRPRQEVLHPTNDLSDEQVKELFAALEQKGPSMPLHKAIVYLLFSTGIRKSELIYLKRKDYKIFDGIPVVEVRAKGGKYLTKALHPECARIMDEYIDWMKDTGRPIHPEDYFFQPTKNPLQPGELCRPLNAKSVDYIIQKFAKIAGLTHRISAHSARASYIGSALEAGVDLLKVSSDVGHASVRTTQEYNKRRLKIKESPAYDLGYFDKKKA